MNALRLVLMATGAMIVAAATTTTPIAANLLAESNVRCCYGDEDRPFALACPPGTFIASVDVASFGDPTGACGAWSLGRCHGAVDQTIAALCIGQTYCGFTPTDAFLGTPDCPDVQHKKLAAQWTCAGTILRTPRALPAEPPLSTRGRHIVDARGARIKLAGVNWYGGQCEEFTPDGLHVNHIRDIAQGIRDAGFNVVRLQWSNEMVKSNPVVEDRYVAANPQLKGLYALDIYTAAVEALAAEGVFVILDNHISDAGWCCSDSDGNGMWHNRNYTEEIFFSHWEYMVDRYKNYSNVIAAELRNELRFTCGLDDANGDQICTAATWAKGNQDYAWKRAAEEAAYRVLRVNPELLIMISGLSYATELGGVRTDPVQLTVPNKLVYVSHDYSWFHPDSFTYDEYADKAEFNWGFVVHENTSWTAPLFVSEFGTCHTDASCVEDINNSATTLRLPNGRWFDYAITYLQEIDADFAVWAWNGSTCKGTGRVYGDEETYGLTNVCWNGIAYPPYLERIQKLQHASPKHD